MEVGVWLPNIAKERAAADIYHIITSRGQGSHRHGVLQIKYWKSLHCDVDHSVYTFSLARLFRHVVVILSYHNS